MPIQVTSSTPITRRVAESRIPMPTTEYDGMPRRPVVRGTPQTPRSGPRHQPSDDISPDVGKVHQMQHGDRRLRVLGREQSGPQGGPHPRRPVGIRDGESGWRHHDLGGTQHDVHGPAAPRVERRDRGPQPGTVLGEHLRHAESAPGARGEDDADDSLNRRYFVHSLGNIGG